MKALALTVMVALRLFLAPLAATAQQPGKPADEQGTAKTANLVQWGVLEAAQMSIQRAQQASTASTPYFPNKSANLLKP